MKKAVSIVLFLIYFVSVSGVAFHLHFCGTYLDSVSVLENDHKGCCCEKEGVEMPRKENCCHDVVVSAEPGDDHNAVSVAKTVSPLSISIPMLYPTVLCINKPAQFELVSLEPPPDQVRSVFPDLHLLNCTFRI